MSQRFCTHLEEYAAQFVRAEAAYRNCNALVERIRGEGATGELVQSVEAVVAELVKECGALRAQLVKLVEAGHVKIPLTASGKPRRSATPICATCGIHLPRLDFTDWKFAGNGAVEFRGEDLVRPESAAVPA